MLNIKGLSVKLPGFVLYDINLQVDTGEFFAIIGPTGSGKSLLLEAVMGLLPGNTISSTGQIFLKDREITHLPPHKRGIGILYQDVALFPHMTVEENIRYGIRYHRIDKQRVEELFSFLTDRFGIRHLLKRYPVRISGGERQRVALCRVLILNPKVLLLDEPLSALDPLFQQEIRQLLRQLHKELGITFVIVSHNFEEVMYLAKKGAVIQKGQIVQQGQIEEIFNRPASSSVARFVGATNVFKVHKKDGCTKVGAFPIILDDKAKYSSFTHISIRPERIVAGVDRLNDGLPENIFEGNVVEMSRQSFNVSLRLERSDGILFHAIWPEYLVRSLGIGLGGSVRFGFFKGDVGTFKE